MKDLESGAATARAEGKPRASVALAGLAAASLSAPAVGAIVSVTDLDVVVEPGQVYTLPGVPQLEFSAFTQCSAWSGPKTCSAYQTHGQVIGRFTQDPGTKAIITGAFSAMGVVPGDVIGPDGFDPPPGHLWDVVGFEDAYFAVEIIDDKQSYFGWVNFSVPAGGDFVVHGFGYNDVAGASIRVGQTTDIPEPDTLALLAAGVVGAAAGSARRRRAQR
jgi:hypothetical protein